MARRVSRVSLILGLILLAFGLYDLSPRAQGPLERLAQQEISEQAGIAPELLATLVVNDDPDQLILAFVLAREAVLKSELKPSLKRGVAPFIGQSALLTLVFPLRPSRFFPTEISFSQGGLTYLIGEAQVHPITEDFRGGRLAAERLSAGVIELPQGLDVGRPFEIRFRGAFSTPFAAGERPLGSADRALAVTARQGGRAWRISPLEGNDSPLAFYAYTGFSSDNPLLKPDASVIFLYRDAASPAELTLFVIHSSSRGSKASFTFWGLPTGTSVVLKDDPDDAYWLSPPTGKISWRWSAGLTDGAVIGGLVGAFRLTVRPDFDEAISRWFVITGTPEGPEHVELSSLDDPLTLEVRLSGLSSSGSLPAPPSAPEARFSFTPTDPLVGEPVTFDASASHSAEGGIVRYLWDFDGDGAYEILADSPVVAHRFRTPGPREVNLQVEDERGRRATATRTVAVQASVVEVIRRIQTFLPGFQALPGTHFTVQLTIEAHTAVVGLGIRESPPNGWEIQPLGGSARFNPQASEWLVLDTLAAGERLRILYRVEVPEAVNPGRYPFSGRLVSGTPKTSAKVGGDWEVEVIQALPVELAVSRLDDEGKIDLTLSNLISFNQILQAIALWQQQLPVPGTNGTRIDLATMVKLVAYWRTATPVDRPLSAGALAAGGG